MKSFKILFSLVGITAALLGLFACGKETEKLDACDTKSRFYAGDKECTCPKRSDSVTQTLSASNYDYTNGSANSTGMFAQSIKGNGKPWRAVVFKGMTITTATLSGVEVSIRADCNNRPCTTSLATTTLTGWSTTEAHATAILNKNVDSDPIAQYWIVFRFMSLNGTFRILGSGFVYADGFSATSNDTGTTWTTGTMGGDLYFKVQACDENGTFGT